MWVGVTSCFTIWWFHVVWGGWLIWSAAVWWVLGLVIICRLALVLCSGLLCVLVWVGGCYLVWVFGRLVTLGLRWLC